MQLILHRTWNFPDLQFKDGREEDWVNGQAPEVYHDQVLWSFIGVYKMEFYRAFLLPSGPAQS